MYGKIEKGFGSFFMFVFGMSQLLIIFSLFLSISQAVGSNRSGWERMVQSFSMLLTASLGLNIYGFGCILDDVHKTFKAISDCLILMSAAASADASSAASAVAKSNVSLLQRFINMYDHLAHP